MKNIIYSLALVSTIASANQSLTVNCYGSSYELAKQNCFKQAVETVFGSVISTSREAQNQNLVRNEIAVYSAGYVDNYKVVSFNGRNMTMDITVNSSKIANRLLTKPNNVQVFESEKHLAQLQTHNEEKTQGDRLLLSVMKDYPKRAFEITQFPYQIRHDSTRQFHIHIPYEIRWNYNWLAALNEALSLTENDYNFYQRAPGHVKIMAKNPNNMLFGKSSTYKFNDVVRVNLIKEQMTGDNDVRLKLIFKDINQKIMHVMCFYPNFVASRGPTMYVLGDFNALTIYGNDVETSFISVQTPKTNETEKFFKLLNEIHLELDTEKNCK